MVRSNGSAHFVYVSEWMTKADMALIGAALKVALALEEPC